MDVNGDQTAELRAARFGKQPGRLGVWLQAVRPFSFTASVTPVLLGAAIAARAGFFSGARLALVVAGALAIHIGTNLINDYYDHVKGADCEGSMGSSKVIQEGLLTTAQVWWGGITAFAFGSAIGLTLVWLCGWPVLAIGIASVAAGYFYTADPVSLAYIALGELTVFLFMGPAIVLGTYYVMALRFAWPPLAASLPIGFLVTAILHANNIRDIESDKVYHKLTLANLLSRRSAQIEFTGLHVGAYLSTAVAILVGLLPWTAILTFVTLFHARDVLRIVFTKTDSKGLDQAVLGSARLHMEFGLALLAAILIPGLFGL